MTRRKFNQSEDDEIDAEDINWKPVKRKKKLNVWNFRFTRKVWNRREQNDLLISLLLIFALFFDVLFLLTTLIWQLGKLTDLLKDIRRNFRKGIAGAFFVIAKWTVIFLFIYICVNHTTFVLQATKVMILKISSLFTK